MPRLCKQQSESRLKLLSSLEHGQLLVRSWWIGQARLPTSAATFQNCKYWTEFTVTSWNLDTVQRQRNKSNLLPQIALQFNGYYVRMWLRWMQTTIPLYCTLEKLLCYVALDFKCCEIEIMSLLTTLLHKALNCGEINSRHCVFEMRSFRSYSDIPPEWGQNFWILIKTAYSLLGMIPGPKSLSSGVSCSTIYQFGVIFHHFHSFTVGMYYLWIKVKCSKLRLMCTWLLGGDWWADNSKI